MQRRRLEPKIPAMAIIGSVPNAQFSIQHPLTAKKIVPNIVIIFTLKLRCPSCGNQVNTNVMFCKYCGEALQIRTICGPVNGISATSSRSKSNVTMIVWFGAIAACAVMLVVLLAFERGHTPKPTILPVLAQNAAPSLEPTLLPVITPIPIPSVLPTPEPICFLKDATVAGNSSNAGLFASNDEWIYFRTGIFQESSNSTYGLYRQPLKLAPRFYTVVTAK